MVISVRFITKREISKKLIRHFNTAIEQAQECDHAINHGVFLGNRATCFMDIHQLDEAQKDLEDAIAICDRHLELPSELVENWHSSK